MFWLKNEFMFSSILIILTIFVFNYNLIFGLDVYILDDHARYATAMTGDHLNSFFLKMGLLPALLKALNYKILLLSPYFARAFYLFVFAIPLSLLVYYFNRKVLHLDNLPSLFVAVMCNILPAQIHIPKFIDGSYPLVGLIFVLLTLIYVYRFMYNYKISELFISLLMWYAANQTLGELGVIISPAVFILLVFSKFNKAHKIWAVSLFCLVTIHRVYQSVSFSRGAAGTPTLHSFSDMWNRVIASVKWGAFFTVQSDYTTIFLLIMFISVLCVGLYLIIKECELNHIYPRIIVFYVFAGLLSMSVFVTVSTYFSTRYFFTSYLFLWSAFGFALHAISKKFIRNGYLVMLIFIAIIITAGVARYKSTEKDNKGYNLRHTYILKAIHALGELRPNAQIILTGTNNGTGEYYVWSSGYLMFCTKRSDVRGLIGHEYSFYNPFDIKERDYRYVMSGLNVNLPLYSIDISKDKKNIRNKQYFLQWADINNMRSTWILYKSKDAVLNVFMKGEGLDEYLTGISQAGIHLNEILWGDPAGVKISSNMKYPENTSTNFDELPDILE